jgi:hypothetical protein
VAAQIHNFNLIETVKYGKHDVYISFVTMGRLQDNIVIVGLPDMAVKELRHNQDMDSTAEATRGLASGASGEFQICTGEGQLVF